MKKLILLIILFIPFVVKAQEDCKCNINNVLTVERNLDNLTAEQIDLFLCTFDTSCDDNAEYGQFSNEVLFKVLDKEPRLLLHRMDKNKKSINIESIIKEFEDPIIDFNLIKIKEELSKESGNEKIKKRIIGALDKAIAAYN